MVLIIKNVDGGSDVYYLKCIVLPSFFFFKLTSTSGNSKVLFM
jgi:hypothetical protein